MKFLFLHAFAKPATAVLALALSLLAGSHSKTPAPEAFTDTARLENIDGAAAFYTFQHPKLIAQGINKLTAEIPEASYLNMVLAAYGGRLGYPEFTEIAAGTNVGIYQAAMSLDELQRHRQPVFILFVKLKENGKIWNALTNQIGLQSRKLGDWAMFAKNTADFDAVKNTGALIARLSAPQAETCRAWFCLNGDTAAPYKTLLTDAISKTLSRSALADAEKTAFAAYARVIIGEILDSTHSATITLNLGDTGVSITEGAQFKPDSPVGIFSRYRSDATPDIARYIANDAIISGVFRFTPKAQRDLSDYLINTVLKVDYPPVSEPLAQFQKNIGSYWEQIGGCGALTINQKIDLANPRGPKFTADTFAAYSGKFDPPSTRQYLQSVVGMAQGLMANMLDVVRANITRARADDLPQISITSATDALTVGDINFDSMTINITPAKQSVHIPPQTTYFGVADGSLVSSSNEATLKKRLPALLAQNPLPDNVAAANPLQPYDLLSMILNGAPLADMVCDAAKIDLTDTDAQATIADIKESYQQSGPARMTVEARQATLALKVDIPYKFISAGVKLGRYVYSVKNTSGN